MNVQECDGLSEVFYTRTFACDHWYCVWQRLIIIIIVVVVVVYYAKAALSSFSGPLFDQNWLL